jgi:glycosyltransferase involved in cell wall biosynthesis
MSPTRTPQVPISVIIPCYRCADTIDRAVASVAAQTALPQEVFLVDDHSADAGVTVASLRRVQEDYGDSLKIQVIEREKNSGPSDARNLAWEQAAYSYIAFLDADDSWHPRKLELQYGWMSAHPEAGFSGQAFREADSEGMLEISTAPSVRLVKKYSLLFSNKFFTSSIMLKRCLPFRFPQGRRYSEDYQLWLALVFHDMRGYIMDTPLTYSYKKPFGAGGLSKNMVPMHRGELENYKELLRSGLISPVLYAAVIAVSYAKYWQRRLLIGWHLQPDG